MAVSNELERIILDDERVASAISRLEHAKKTRNPLAKALDFLARRVVHHYSREELLEMARSYVEKVRSETDTDIMYWTGGIADFIVTQLFATSHSTGLEKLTTAAREGKRVKLYTTHLSYYDLAELPHELRKHGVNNVHYIGGQNVTNTPIVGMILGPLFRKSGFVQFDRSLKGKKAMLQEAVLQAYAAYLLNNGAFVLDFSGRGRNRHEVEPVRASSSDAAITDADVTFPIAIAYDDPPEGRDFALESKRRAGKAVIKYMLHPITKLRDKGCYGDVYLTVGESIESAPFKEEYMASSRESHRKAVVREFELCVTRSMVRALTLTPTGLLAAAINGSRNFTLEQVAAPVEATVNDAYLQGANIAESLMRAPRESLEHAAYTLAERGALRLDKDVWEVKEPKIVQYFAEKAIHTLKEFGVLGYEGRAMQEKPEQHPSPQISA